MKNINFRNAVLVVAHPDDEILFFSSILTSCKKIIICFGPCSSSSEVSKGREELINDYPLKNVEFLNTIEINEPLPDIWKKPKATEYGIEVKNSKIKYEHNYETLKNILKDKLRGEQLVLTHNPWGEYGHAEHVQIYRVIFSLKEKYRYDLLVSSYVSDRTLPLMFKYNDVIKISTNFLRTDKALASRLKKIYLGKKCWTWDDMYEWPEYEYFLKVEENSNKKSFPYLPCSLPLNVIYLDEHNKFYWRILLRIINKLFPEQLSTRIVQIGKALLRKK